MALLTGLAFFTMFIRIPTDQAELRRERRLAIVGGAALVIGSAVLLLNQGPIIPQRLLLLLGLRALAGAAAAGLLFVSPRLMPADARREATAFFGLAAGLTATLVSHAAASGDVRYAALDYLHVIAISIWRGVIGETTLFAGVLVAAAFLTSFAPPAQANGAAFDETKHVSGIRIELLTATTLPGRNRFAVRVQQGLTPISGAEKVTLRFTMVEHDMGEQELVTTERAPGEYVVEGSPTAMLGTWKVQVIVRLAGRADIQPLFTVPVSQPAGQDATTKGIAVPPYQLIVFSEPFQPQAGAPLTINVVVVDSKGDPVTGKKVRATFSGTGTQAPLDGVENVAELGPGRYRFTVPGLDAGSWKVTLSMSDAGSGVYELDVSR